MKKYLLSLFDLEDGHLLRSVTFYATDEDSSDIFRSYRLCYYGIFSCNLVCVE